MDFEGAVLAKSDGVDFENSASRVNGSGSGIGSVPESAFGNSADGGDGGALFAVRSGNGIVGLGLLRELRGGGGVGWPLEAFGFLG